MAGLEGRRALVTGGAVRLGRAIVLELARGGADLVVHCHSSVEAGQELVEEVRRLGRRAVLVQADLVEASGVERLFSEADRGLGPVDILVNNAGTFERQPFADIAESALRHMLDVNFIAPFLCAQQAAERMKRQGKGAIVNIVDIGGSALAWKGYAHYCASKAALTMLTKVLASELASEGIRVNAVAPGAVLFPVHEDEALRARVLARVPAGHEGTPEDVARTVRFLVEGPDYITGQVLAVDGGRSAAG